LPPERGAQRAKLREEFDVLQTAGAILDIQPALSGLRRAQPCAHRGGIGAVAGRVFLALEKSGAKILDLGQKVGGANEGARTGQGQMFPCPGLSR
jgi:hypothetical protein